MRSFVMLLAALFLLSLPSFAQDKPDYDKTFKGGFDAITSGRLDDGIAAFKKCLELRPEEPTCAYNLGCGYSRKGEKDLAFEWLDKSADWGFGNMDGATGVSNLVFTPTDTDLTALHDDPRWAKFMEKLTSLRKPFDELRATAAVYIPKALEGAAELPLLVVLHDSGKTRNSVVEGRWKQIADELGCALVAPSAKIPRKPSDIEAGMVWFNNPTTYATGFRNDERPVSEAVSAFQKAHKLVAERVFIAGEGMGATVAFNIAIGKPTFYKGVLMLDGVVHGSLAAPRVPAASKAGLRVHALFNKGAMTAVLAGKDPQPLIDSVGKSLSGWSLINKLEVFEVKEGEADPTEAKALAALKSFQVPAAVPVPVPAEAGSGK